MRTAFMKNYLVLVVLLVFSTAAMGQMAKSEVTGNWEVQQIVKKSTKPEFRGLLDGFEKATFIFGQNGDFSLTTSSKAPTFQMLLRMTEGTQWKFDVQEQLIKVGREEDGYSIMRIYPTKKEGTVEFALDGSEMILEVQNKK